MSFGLAMGGKARANAARKTGQRELLDYIAEQKARGCNAAKLRNWSAPPCDCEFVITFTLTDGRVVRSCAEHGRAIGTMIRSRR